MSGPVRASLLRALVEIGAIPGTEPVDVLTTSRKLATLEAAVAPFLDPLTPEQRLEVEREQAETLDDAEELNEQLGEQLQAAEAALAAAEALWRAWQDRGNVTAAHTALGEALEARRQAGRRRGPGLVQPETGPGLIYSEPGPAPAAPRPPLRLSYAWDPAAAAAEHPALNPHGLAP